MKYRRLFEIRIRHGFYDDDRCPDLCVEPAGARFLRPPVPSAGGILVGPKPLKYVETGERTLARYRMRTRLLPDGIDVFAPVLEQPSGSTTAASKLLIDVDPDTMLRFDLRLQNPNFDLFTEPPPHHVDPVYTNASLAQGVFELRREPGTTVPRVGVLAGVELSGLNSSWLAAPPRFTITFSPRRSRWIYPLLSKRAVSPRVVDADSGRAGEPLRFDVEPLSSGGSTESYALDDPLLGEFLADHNDHRRYLLVSSAPIVCRQAPHKRLELYLGDELLFSDIPNPPLSNHSVITIKQRPAAPPERALYRVISC